MHAVRYMKAGQSPSDEIALDVSIPFWHFVSLVTLTHKTLTVFLAGVLSKRYTNPSSDVIMVLAGLETIDSVFTDFANAIEVLIRNGRTRMQFSCICSRSMLTCCDSGS